MSRYAIAATAAAPPALEGDNRFLGLDMRIQAAPGFLSRAENKRMIDDVAYDRPGVRTPVFANGGTGATGYLGSGVYSNPNGRELCLLAASNGVIAIRFGTVGQPIPVATVPTGKIEFAQHFDKVLIHSDDVNFPVQVWDGLSPEGFVLVVVSDDILVKGIQKIPNVPWSINYLSRAWFQIPDQPGFIGASDINDYTIWDSILHKFRINSGTADELVGLYPYRSAFGLIVGKTRSFSLLGPIPGDLGDAWVLGGAGFSSAPPPAMNDISGPPGVGMAARKGGLFVGGDFLFLSAAGGGGIYRITNSGSGLYIDPIPISHRLGASIRPIIRRINWDFIGGAVANADGVFAYWFVPIDGATFNNAAIVLNTVTGQWMSLDLWFGREVQGRGGRTVPAEPNPLRADNVLGFDFNGRRRLYAINQAVGAVHLLYEGRDDQLGRSDKTGQERRTYPIQSIAETRGYATQAGQSPELRKLSKVNFVLSTYDPNVTISQLVAGVNDETVLDTYAPDRTQYNIFGNAPFQLDNRNDDFLAPGRLDYAIECGDGLLPGSVPLPIESEQETTRPVTLIRKTRQAIFRIENTGGSCALLATQMESVAATREPSK